MSNLEKLKRKFKQGEINKGDYINKMFEIHSSLFDYSDFIKKTDIKNIMIDEENVIMETRNDGIKMICDKYDRRIIPIEILNLDVYEIDETNILKELVTDNSVVFDIGANIGYYSLVLSKWQKKCKIYSFEPIPKTYNYLLSNIKLNQCSNIYTNNIALSNKDGEEIFYYNKMLSGNSSMKVLNSNVELEEFRCKLSKMDTYVKDNLIEKIDVIKCDTEGSELLVFEGGIESIRRFKPAVYTEILRKWSKEFDYNSNDIINLFLNLGYSCFVVNKDKITRITEITEDTMETNFLFLHNEKHKEFIKKHII